MAKVLRKSRLACAVGRCGSCGGGLIRGAIKCECWCHRRGKPRTSDQDGREADGGDTVAGGSSDG